MTQARIIYQRDRTNIQIQVQRTWSRIVLKPSVTESALHRGDALTMSVSPSTRREWLLALPLSGCKSTRTQGCTGLFGELL